jgi:uncharacterized protein (UPF0335 family)
MHNLTNEQIEAMFKERIEKNKKEINEILANAKTSDEKAEYQKLIDEVLSENTPDNPRLARFIRSIIRTRKEHEQEKRERQLWRNDQVKTYLSAMANFQKAIIEAKEALEFGKFAPEARRFAINKHDKICAALDEFNQLLGDYEADIKKAMQESGQ